MMSFIWSSFLTIKSGGSLQEQKLAVHRRLCVFQNVPFKEYSVPFWLFDALSDEDPQLVRRFAACAENPCFNCEPFKQRSGVRTIVLIDRPITEDLLVKGFIRDCSICNKSKFDTPSPLLMYHFHNPPHGSLDVPRMLKIQDLKYFIYAIVYSSGREGGHFKSYISFDGSWYHYDAMVNGGVAQGVRIPKKIQFPTNFFYIREDLAGKLTRLDKDKVEADRLRKFTLNLNYDDWEAMNESKKKKKVSKVFTKKLLEWSDLLKVSDRYPVEDEEDSEESDDLLSSQNDESSMKLDFRGLIDTIKPSVIEEEGGLPMETINAVLGGELLGVPLKLELQDEHALDEGNVKSTIDIDSVLFTAENLNVTTDFKFYAFPNRNATITKDNHVFWTVKGNQVPIFRIPNYQLGTTGENSHFHINIFFPNMMYQKNTRWVNFITATSLALFYDEAIKPTLDKVLPQSIIREFPESYAIATMKATTHKGTYHFTTKLIAKSYTEKFFEELRVMVDSNPSLEQFKDYFFHVHGKDLKMILRKDYGDLISQFQDQFDDFEWDPIRDQLLVDVGLEFWPPEDSGYTFLWKKDITEGLFLGSGFSLPNRHPWCLLKNVMGGSGKAKVANRRNGVSFLQVYQLEKSLHYVYEQGGAMRFSTHDLIANTEIFKKCMTSFRDGWEKAKQSRRSYGVRMEWRMELG